MTLFARLHEGGNTIVLVTHEADVAADAHRTISLRDGQVEKDVRSEAHVAQRGETKEAKRRTNSYQVEQGSALWFSIFVFRYVGVTSHRRKVPG